MNLVHKGLVTRFCCVNLICLAGLAALTLACGRERRESGATVVPVVGLTYASFSLAGETD